MPCLQPIFRIGQKTSPQILRTKVTAEPGVFTPHWHLFFSFAFLSPLSWQWLRNPGPQHEKRTLFGDMVCFLFITPLATISGWLCLRGAVDHLHFSSRLEAVGLIALTVALFTIYLFWTLVSMVCGRGGSQLALADSRQAEPRPMSAVRLTCPVERK